MSAVLDKVAEVLSGAAETAPQDGEATKVAPPKVPTRQRATAAKAKAKPAAKAKGKARTKSTTPRPAVSRVTELPAKIARVLKRANERQVRVALRTLTVDPNAVFQSPDADQDIIVRYTPGWEQGRMKDGVFVKGPGRMFVYLIDKQGELSGHGYKYRSIAAEKKLAPLEAKNAARLEREAKKAA